MKRLMLGGCCSAVVLLSLGAWQKLTEGQETVQRATLQLRAQSLVTKKAAYERWRELAREARDRALLYEQLIEARHLEEGMLVNRHYDGRAASECDSLLFSSLRYISLEKMGWHEQAREAWLHIENEAYENGRWIRHPNCRRKSTSRDMIVGLMSALTQKPLHHEAHVRNLLSIIERTGGSIDDGPFYVSRLSPGLGELLKVIAQRAAIPAKQWPESLRMGFSTLEFDTWIAAPGYTSHLNALTLWMELELLDRDPRLHVRTLTQLVDSFFRPVWPMSLNEQRRVWAAQSLYQLDPGNLFFEWLQLKTAGALTYNSRAVLLEKLLAMPQFPVNRLPNNCDRKADYLWQRSSREYRAGRNCHETFAGVDFLWMTALLTQEPNLQAIAARDSP